MDLSTIYKNFQVSKLGKSGRATDIEPYIGSSGDWKKTEGKDAIIASVRNLLMTPLGCYPFDPTFGSLLRQQLFELADDTTFSQIQYEVKNRIEEFEPRVSVSDVTLTWTKPQKLCTVSVTLSIQDEVNNTKLSIDMTNSVSEMFTSVDEE